MGDLNHWIFRNVFYLTLMLRGEWFLPRLQELNRTQYLDGESLRDMQLGRLNKLLTHASENVAFYQGNIPLSLESLDELGRLPFLEKDQLRRHAEALTYRYGASQRSKTSGGSTGAPVTLIKDARGMAQEMAAMWRGYSWAGVRIGERQARFWGVPRDGKDRARASLIDFVCNRKRVTAFEYNAETMRASVETIKRFNPDYFYGYTSILKEFAEAQPERRILQPKAIITTSEVLMAADRQMLETTFNAQVFDEYGCGEVGTIAHECAYGNKHINAENVIVEVVDSNGAPVDEGETGELVVTDLTNYSMPLIRYRMKDFGAVRSTRCPCGRGLPVLSEIHGRAYDALINSQGSKFHGEFFLYMLEDLKKQGICIEGVQFVQNTDASLSIAVKCEPNYFAIVESFLIHRLRESFDDNLPVVVKKVSSIPREPSGKLRVVKREV